MLCDDSPYLPRGLLGRWRGICSAKAERFLECPAAAHTARLA